MHRWHPISKQQLSFLLHWISREYWIQRITSAVETNAADTHTHTQRDRRMPSDIISSPLTKQGRFYVEAGRHVPPRFTCCPQIQKLADRSDMISKVPKCSKIQIFRGSAPDPDGRVTVLPQIPQLMGKGLAVPSQEPHPHSRPFGPRFYGSQGLTHYGVDNPTNDRFQM